MDERTAASMAVWLAVSSVFWSVDVRVAYWEMFSVGRKVVP